MEGGTIRRRRYPRVGVPRADIIVTVYGIGAELIIVVVAVVIIPAVRLVIVAAGLVTCRGTKNIETIKNDAMNI